MTRALRPAAALVLAGLLAAVLGCPQPNTAPQGSPGGPPGGGGGGNPAIREIMSKLTKGPMSLQSKLGNELQADPPDWDMIQPQAHEYAELAAKMGPLEPTKGSKESWATQTKAYADSAAALDKAAQAKDRDAAMKAHRELANECQGCHREHRGGVGGPMPGGPPPGPGGPPPRPGKPD